jgi:hypothetical protein
LLFFPWFRKPNRRVRGTVHLRKGQQLSGTSENTKTREFIDFSIEDTGALRVYGSEKSNGDALRAALGLLGQAIKALGSVRDHASAATNDSNFLSPSLSTSVRRDMLARVATN